MNKYIIGIDGMRCGGCEAHVQDVVRRNFTVKSVKASHVKKEVVIICDHDLSDSELHLIFDPTGYKITSIVKHEAQKKFFRWR